MRLSIIIPVYNVKKYIRECLDSVVCGILDYRSDVEVIIVDDGSTDGSEQIADEYGEHSNIRIIHQANAGVACARNAGIDIAVGEYIWLVDSDDCITSNGIKDILECIEESESSDVLLFDAFKNINGKNVSWEHFDDDKDFDDSQALLRMMQGVLYYPFCKRELSGIGESLAAPWDKVYKKSFLDDYHIRFAPELKVLDDMFFNLKVFGAASRVRYCKKPIYQYRIVTDSITHGYRANRIEEDKQVWDALFDFVDSWANDSRERLMSAIYCRIVKSYGISLTKYVFNRNNPASLKDRMRLAIRTLESEPYNKAFEVVPVNMLEFKLRILLLLARCRCSVGLWFITCLQNSTN